MTYLFDDNSYREPSWGSWFSDDTNASYRDALIPRPIPTGEHTPQWKRIESPSVPVPSPELLTELVWDVFDSMPDTEVRDRAMWVGWMLMGFSLSELGTTWAVTKDAARAVLRRVQRLLGKRSAEAESFFEDCLYLATRAYSVAQRCAVSMPCPFPPPRNDPKQQFLL